jgi:hypothetical protein
MRASRMAAIGAVALALGGSAAVLGSTSAFATSTTATSIIDFRASPATVSVGHTQVTLTGKLVANGDEQDGIAGQEVWVNYMGLIAGSTSPTIDWAGAETGAGGAFTLSLTLAGGSTFSASFSGNSTYAPSPTPSVTIDSAAEPTKVTLNPLPKLVPLNTTLHLTGKAEAEASNGKWYPLSGVNINAGVSKFFFTSTRTKSDGTFSVEADAYLPGAWQAMVWTGFAPQDALYARVPSNSQVVHVEYKSRVSNLSVAVKSAAHRAVTIKGTVQNWEYSLAQLHGAFGWIGTPGLTVTYYYQDLPSTKWIKAGTVKTGANGVFTRTLAAKAGHLRWKAEVTRQALDGNVYLATTSGTKDSDIRA